MNKQTRRQHSLQDKARILRLHLLHARPISEICQAEGIHPARLERRAANLPDHPESGIMAL